MNSLVYRFVRPVLVAILLSASAVGIVHSAQFARLVQFNPMAQFDFMPLARISVSGAFMAGRQAMQDLRTDEAARFFAQAARRDWDNPLLVERAFVAYAIDGQIRQAASTAKHLLSLAPGNELAELVVATEALKERRYAAAGRMLVGIGENSFTGITAGILRAWALIGENRFSDAEAVVEGLGGGNIDDFLVFHRAMMAEAVGETEKAARLAETAFDREPYVARVAEVYARILANAGQWEEAADVIARYEGQGLTHPLITIVKQQVEGRRRPGVFSASVQIGAAEMFHGIGTALARDGTLDLALVFLRLGVYLDPSGDAIVLALGQLLDASSQHEAANSIYESIPASSPMKPVAVVRVAQNLDAKGDRTEALRRLNNIVVNRPDDLDAISVLGDLLRYDEQYLPAAEAYTKALALTGGKSSADWRFYYVRGIAYERAQEWPNAEADFKRALELNPDQPQVLNYLGYSWLDMDMHLEEALSMIEKAVATQPQDGYIVDSLGWAFYKLGRLDDAVATLERAVQIRPGDAEINDHLGDAYWRAGRKLEARFQWDIASSVDEVGNVKARVAPKLAEGLAEESLVE